MNRSSRRATTFVWTMLLAIIVPILAACGGTTPAQPSAGASVPAASVAAPSAAEPSEAASTEASPSAEASAEASEDASASADASPSSAAGAPTPAESPINEKVFVYGTNQSPDTLFVAESTSSATQQVVFGLGTCVTNRSYDYQTTYCFDEFPTFENGGAVSETVQIDPSTISPESPIVVNGEVVTDTAAAEAAGIEIPTELAQLTTTYKLNEDLYWEDGQQVTSADAIESLRVVEDPDLQSATRFVADRLNTVEAPDDFTVVQTWAPGFTDTRYYTYFIGFVPTHIYGGQSLDEIRQAESVHPVSFGPYMVQEHEAGSQTTLVSNPYFKTQPKIGTIVFKYITEQDQVLAQLESGEIDFASPIALTLGQSPQLTDLEAAGTIKTQYVPATTWEHVDFGIQRGDGEPSFFDDVRIRQAVAYATNRQEIIDNVLYGKTTVMNTYVPSDHPSYPGDDALEAYAFDPERAKQLLDDAGVTDSNGDGVREKDGREMNITFYTTQGNATRQAVAEIMQQNLNEVGINIELQFVPGPDVLFKNGAEGILYGRRFDLAMYAWVSGPDASHLLYRGDQVPTEENGYAGQNSPAYQNPDFDTAAKAADAELDIEKKQELDKVPLTIFNRDLPTFPLYQRVNIAAFKPTVTGIEIDPTSDYELWNIEQIDITE